eukprot:1858358-Rhodomonas_salina.1
MDWDSTRPNSEYHVYSSHTCLDVRRVLEPGSALDCATTGDVANNAEIQRVTHTGRKCLLLSVHGTTVTCDEVLVGHPTVTKDSRPIIIQTGGKG